MSDSSVTPWTVTHQAPSIHGISQARTLEWVAISFSRGSSRPRDRTLVSRIDRHVLYHLSHQGSPKNLLLGCCCQVASVVSDSVRPHRRQPTRLPPPRGSPSKNTGVGCHFFSNAGKWKVKAKSLSHVQLLVTPWIAAHQAPPSTGFSRRECWSGVSLPSPGDLPDPGIEPRSPAL